MKICPSIASADVLNIQKECDYISRYFGHIHIDVEDGNYIDNITFGLKTLGGICKVTSCEKSVHLMVTNPADYAEALSHYPIDIVFMHLDNCRYPLEVLGEFEKYNLKIGIALNPADALERYEYLSSKIDDVLIMMCEPDGHHQQYQPALENKVKKILNKGYRVWLDGSLNIDLVNKWNCFGVYSTVIGRDIFCDKQKALIKYDEYLIKLETKN